MQSLMRGVCCLIILAGLSGCLSTQAPQASLLIETPNPSETPTPTIVWFPPTATTTPWTQGNNNQNPTPNPVVNHGSRMFQDDFTDPSQWSLGVFPAGSIQFGLNELSIGVTRPGGYLYSLRKEPSIGDFYLEITASPSICRGKDEFGVLLRVSNNLDYFRFGINCLGEARLDRVLSGQASSSKPPELNGSIPPGAPSQSRLGVWADGKEIRCYANNTLLFSIQDPSLVKGMIGVYARSAGQDAMTVNFTELSVYEIQP